MISLNQLYNHNSREQKWESSQEGEFTALFSSFIMEHKVWKSPWHTGKMTSSRDSSCLAGETSWPVLWSITGINHDHKSSGSQVCLFFKEKSSCPQSHFAQDQHLTNIESQMIHFFLSLNVFNPFYTYKSVYDNFMTILWQELLSLWTQLYKVFWGSWRALRSLKNNSW